MADGNEAPLRVLEGQATLIARTTHDLAVDPIHDEIVAPNPFAEAILVFRGGASGEEAPKRIIQGPKTKLSRNTDNVALDPVHNEIYTVQSRYNAIFVFDREAQGDVAPIRVIQGPNTKLNGPSRIAADPVNNLIAVTTGDGIVIFDRTASGDAAPRTVISGPKTGLGGDARAIRVTFYPEGKKIFVAVTGGRSRDGMKYGSVSVWRYEDKGDVAPWAILRTSEVTKLKDPFGGVALNPEAKEVMVMENDHPAALLVYHLPEVFQ